MGTADLKKEGVNLRCPEGLAVHISFTTITTLSIVIPNKS